MTKGDAGQNISKFASSSTDASKITTSLPYISYVDLGDWLHEMVDHALAVLSSYVNSLTNPVKRSAIDFKAWCDSSSNYNDVFICDGYRLLS